MPFFTTQHKDRVPSDSDTDDDLPFSRFTHYGKGTPNIHGEETHSVDQRTEEETHSVDESTDKDTHSVGERTEEETHSVGERADDDTHSEGQFDDAEVQAKRFRTKGRMKSSSRPADGDESLLRI